MSTDSSASETFARDVPTTRWRVEALLMLPAGQQLSRFQPIVKPQPFDSCELPGADMKYDETKLKVLADHVGMFERSALTQSWCAVMLLMISLLVLAIGNWELKMRWK